MAGTAVVAVLISAPRVAHTRGEPAGKPHLLRSLVASTGAAGGVMVVESASGRWIGTRGVSDLKTRTPMRAATRFRVGDVTQAFTAVAVLDAIAGGWTHLAQPAADLLYDLRSDVHVRHLLTHTSGVLRNGSRVPPGEFAYHEQNYVLLAAVLEASTGSAFRGRLRERVFRRLALRSTDYEPDARVVRLARGYTGSRRRQSVEGSAAPLHARAKGIVSTPTDLARFVRAILGGRLLPESETRDLTSSNVRVRRFAAERFGLGLFRVRTPCGVAWGQRGTDRGHTVWMFGTSDGKTAVAAAVNVGGLSLGRLLQAEQSVRAALCP